MNKNKEKVNKRLRRHLRGRKDSRGKRSLNGTKDKPRIAVYRSVHHIYAQAIDDEKQHTMACSSTLSKDIKEKINSKNNINSAKLVGEALGKKLKDIGIQTACFDKGGFRYHGKIKALADAVRAQGIKF